MTRDQIITEIYQNNIVSNIAQHYNSVLLSYKSDFISYMYEVLCNIPEKKLIQLYNDNQLLYYIIYIIKAQAYNKNSDFWKTHKGKIIIDGSIDDENYHKYKSTYEEQ